jgi:hypothetical protein
MTDYHKVKVNVCRPVLSSCQAPTWGPRPNFYYCQTFAGLLIWDALPDERTSLPFTIADCPRQHTLFRARVPRNSRPYFTVSDSRLPQPGGSGRHIKSPSDRVAQSYPQALGSSLSPPTTRRATGEVFEPASTLGD